MTIKEELLELNTTKQGIKEVFEEKGVDLTNKKFSDTPSMIRQMNTGKGDEVEAFAVGAAKEAAADDKVILNYAADMLPEEQVVTDSKFEKGSEGNSYLSLVYCDKKRIYMTGWLDSSTLGCPQYFERQEDGTYLHVGQITLRHNGRWYPVPFSLMANYDNSATDLYSFNKTSSTYYGSYARQRGCLTFSSDFQYASSGGFKNYLFKRVEENWVSLTNWESSNDDGYGIIGDRLILFRSGNLNTYSFDEGNFEIVGTTTTTDFSNGYMQYWRLFSGNSKAIVKNTNAASSSNSAAVFHIANITFDGTLYSISKDVELTTLLQGYIAGAGITSVYNIMIVDDKDIYVWGAGGIVALRYENGTLTLIATPFPDLAWTGAFFINPVDKMAILQTDPKTCYVRYLDAPVTQKYMATAAGDGLQFQSVSLTGFVKENKSGILKVSTVLDPNAVVPSYPDTYGLNVTVHPGHAEGEKQEWTRPNLTSATSYGVVSDSRNNSSEAGWKALDGSFSSNFVPATTAGWWKWKLPTHLSFTVGQSLITWVHRNNSETMGGTNVMQFFTNETMSVALTEPFSDPSSSNQAVELPVIYTGTTDEVYLKIDAHSGYGGAAEIQFTNVKSIDALQEGSIDISRGWFKNGADYVKWEGAPAATLADVEGEKEMTMDLWLVEKENVSVKKARFSKNGTVIVVQDEAKGFGANSYLLPNFITPFDYGRFELIFPFKTGTNFLNQNSTALLGRNDNRNISIDFADTNGTLEIRFSSNGSSYDIGTLSTVLQTGTKYWLKVSHENGVYKAQLSTNGTDYALLGTLSSETKMFGGIQNYIGTYKESSYGFNGTIYLDEFKMTFDSVSWTPYTTTFEDILTPVISVAEPSSYRVRHHIGQVYLSETLDYFMPNPYGLEPSVQYGYDEKAFEQSVLTANGTLGGDSFAVAATDSYSSSYYPYKPFASTTSLGWISNSSASADSPIYYTMYFPDAVCLTQIVQRNRSDVSTETLGDFTIQGSNDNAEWVDIASFSNRTSTPSENLTFDLSINTATYNYYRFAITSNSAGNSGRVSIGMLTLTAHFPNSFWAGSVTIDDGWQELEGIRYILPTTTIKEFADVIIGEKATTMYLWLTKTGTTTDFVVSVNAPSGVGSSYQVMPVYLNNALDKFVKEAETVIAVNIADALAGDNISCMKGVSLS